GTINFDPIGLEGVQREFSLRDRDSEVRDPLTGIPRQISDYPKITNTGSIRCDIPDTNWTLVAGIVEFQNYAVYRLDQISRNWGAPSVNFFKIENKDVFGVKVGLQLVNLNDTSENFKREVYCNQTCSFVDDPTDPAFDPTPRLRLNAVDFIEERHRTF